MFFYFIITVCYNFLNLISFEHLDICWLRLDFEQNTIEAPSATTEASGGACVDSMTVTVSNTNRTTVSAVSTYAALSN